MKTIAEIALERSLDRSTLLKAAQRGAFAEAARKSGDTWLIDDESEAFTYWLAGAGKGRPRTIKVEAPAPPDWVNTSAAKYAWKASLNWRVNAASAGTEQYRRFLLREAERLYGDK